MIHKFTLPFANKLVIIYNVNELYISEHTFTNHLQKTFCISLESVWVCVLFHTHFLVTRVFFRAFFNLFLKTAASQMSICIFQL